MNNSVVRVSPQVKFVLEPATQRILCIGIKRPVKMKHHEEENAQIAQVAEPVPFPCDNKYGQADKDQQVFNDPVLPVNTIVPAINPV